MPHVVQRCSSLGDSVGAGLSSPWLLFVAVRGCSWPCMAAWWHCLLPVMRCLAVAVRPLLAFPFLPCVPPSRRYAPAMMSGRALCDSQLKGRFRQPWKTGIPESFLFSVYTAGNRFPWADVLFLCAVWWRVPSGMYAVWWCVPPCGHVVRGRKSSLSLLHGRVSPM